MQNCIHCPLEWFNPKHHWKSSTLFIMRIAYVLLCTLCMRWFGVCFFLLFVACSSSSYPEEFNWLNKICMQIHQLSMQLDQWTSENVNFSPRNQNKWRCIFVMGENLWHNQAIWIGAVFFFIKIIYDRDFQLYIYRIRSDIFYMARIFIRHRLY